MFFVVDDIPFISTDVIRLPNSSKEIRQISDVNERVYS